MSPYNIFNGWLGGFIYDDLKEFINTYYDSDSMFYNILIKNYNTDQIWIHSMCFISKWKFVYPVIKFLSDFYDWYIDKYNLNYNTDKIKDHIEKEFINKNDWSDKGPYSSIGWLYPGRYRVFAYICEYILGWCLYYNLENNK